MSDERLDHWSESDMNEPLRTKWDAKMNTHKHIQAVKIAQKYVVIEANVQFEHIFEACQLGTICLGAKHKCE